MQDLENLNILATNLKKSVNNVITDETLKAKLELATRLFRSIDLSLEDRIELSDSEITSIEQTTNKIFLNIKEITGQKLEENRRK